MSDSIDKLEITDEAVGGYIRKLDRDPPESSDDVTSVARVLTNGPSPEEAEEISEEIVRRYNTYENLVDIIRYVRGETANGHFSSGDLVEELLRRIEAVETNHEIDLSPDQLARPIEDLPFREGDYIKIPERNTIGYVTRLSGIDDTWLIEIQVCGLIGGRPPEEINQQIRLDELEEDPHLIRMNAR